MKAYQELSKEELVSLKAELEKKFEDAKGKGLKLDMSRGKAGGGPTGRLRGNAHSGESQRGHSL